MAEQVSAPGDYADWLADLKARIHAAQQRAVLAVNRELVLLYWQIGRDILARQSAQGWGAKVIDRLARDLRQAFPEMKGFSGRSKNQLCHSCAGKCVTRPSGTGRSMAKPRPARVCAIGAERRTSECEVLR